MHNFIKNKYNVIFCVEFILFFILSIFFVPTNDDINFKYFFEFNGLSEFIHQTLYYGNGRLLGNGFAIFFSKHPQTFYFIETIIVFSLAAATEKLTEVKNSKILVAALVLLQPVFGFKETISWMSSFINYVIPVFLLILTLIMLKYQATQKSKFFYLLLFFIGFSEQLFVEHNTIINVLIAVSILIYCFVKNIKSSKADALVLLFSNIAGALTMFLYKFYIDYSQTHVGQYSEPYRKTILAAFYNGGIKEAILFACKNVKHVFQTYGGAILLIGIVYAVMIYIEAKSEKKNIKHKSFIFLSIGCYILSFAVNTYAMFKYGDYGGHSIFLIMLIAVSTLSSILSTAIIFYKTIIKRCPKDTGILFFILAFFAILAFAPFLLVGPCGYRCTFFTLFFMILFALYTVKFAVTNYDFKIEKIYNYTAVLLCAVLVLYTALYAREKKIYNYKTEYVKSSQYLPSANANLISEGDTQVVWDKVSGFKHEYIPLEEFEKIIENK